MNWDWDYTADIVLPALIGVLPVTIIATIASFILALLVGLIFVTGRMSRHGWISAPVRELTEFIRGTPILVQLYVVFFVLPEFGVVLPPLFTGILVLGLHNGAYLTEVFRAGLESVPTGQKEAAIALNLGPGRTFVAVVAPQAIPPILPDIGNYLVAIFKETPLLSFIAVLEILHEAKIVGNEHFRFLEPITIAGIFFLVMSLIAAAGIGFVERAVNRMVFRR